MNCCETNGQCTQSMDCPARPMVTNGIPVEAGNVWFAEPEPIELTRMETVLIYLYLAIGSIATIAILAGAAGWVYGTLK